MEELIVQLYPNYARKEDFLEIPTDIDDVYFLIEHTYRHVEYPKRVRLKEPFREELLMKKKLLSN